MHDVGNELSVARFLIEFGVALSLVCALALVWREWLRRRPAGEGAGFRLLDPYQHAWLRSGEQAAIGKAVANLLRRGSLILDRDEPQRVHLQDFDGVTHPLEIDVLNAVARYGSLQIEQIPYATLTTAISDALVAQGLISPPGRRWWSLLPAVLVVPVVVFVGAIQALELAAAGQAVAPVVSLTVCGAYAITRLCLPGLRTRVGDEVLKQLDQAAPRRDLIASLLAIRLNTDARQIA